MSLKNISPSGIAFLIRTYIGKEIYNSVHPMTKKILLIDAIKAHKIWIKEKYGSEWEYKKVWCKENGFETPNKYRKFLAEINGYESSWKMFVARSGKSVKEILDNQAKNKGFKNFKEYQDNLAKLWGFKNIQDYKKSWSKMKRKENYFKGICTRCGSERENKSYVLCNICRNLKNKNAKIFRDKNRFKGLCIYCGKIKVKEDYAKCDRCRNINKESTKRYRKNLDLSNYKKYNLIIIK